VFFDWFSDLDICYLEERRYEKRRNYCHCWICFTFIIGYIPADFNARMFILVCIQMSCRLCEAYKNKDGTYRDVHEWFFELICDTHKVPLLVLKEHRAKLTDEEEIIVGQIAEILYPNRKPRGTGMHSIVDHWHEHYI